MSLQEIQDSLGDLVAAVQARDQRLDDVERRVNQVHAGFIGGGGGSNSHDRVYGYDDPRLRALSQDRDYSSAFATYLQTPGTGLGGIMGSLSVGSDREGGYLVPVDESGRIVATRDEASPLRSIASVTQTTSDHITGIADTGEASSGWVGEQSDRPETDAPDLKEWRIDVHEIYAMPVATQRLVDDASRVSFSDWLIGKIGTEFGKKEAAAFITGDGVCKPRGLLNYTAEATGDADRDWGKLEYVPTGVSGAFPTISGLVADSADPLYDLVSKLKSHYRPRGRWMMNRATANAVRKLKDGNGRNLWVDGLAAGQSDTLLGFGVSLEENMPDIAADSLSIAFGDFSGYQIVDRLGITVLRDPLTTKGKVKYYSRMRVGGALVDFESVKLLKFSAS